MTPSKVMLCVLGTVALLDVAAAKRVGQPMMKHAVPKVLPVSSPAQGIQNAAKQVGGLMAHLRKAKDARRLTDGEGGPGAGGPTTTVTTYVNEAGEPTCDLDNAMPEGPPEDVQAMIESEFCLHPEDQDISMSFSFDGRSLVIRTFHSLNCVGPREVTTLPCGCTMGTVLSGHLCDNVPPPLAYVTYNEEAPGKCLGADPPTLVFRTPIWDGCYHASTFLSGETIEFIRNRTNTMTEVHARIELDVSAGVTYSVHRDADCNSPPDELFSLSCDCLRHDDTMMMKAFTHMVFHLTGDICANPRQTDVRVYQFMPSVAHPCYWPQWQATMVFGVCHPVACTWNSEDAPCNNSTSMMAVIMGAQDGTPAGREAVAFFEYAGHRCDGPPQGNWTLMCGECTQVDEHDHPEVAEPATYVKMVGHFCSGGGGQCTRVPRSMIPSEIEPRLMPCMSM